MAATDQRKIVIVGGGIIGVTSAYYLSRHPKFDPAKHSITLLEASKIAGGASGKAGGLLALWAYPKSIVSLSYKLHAELAAEHGGEHKWGYRTVHCAQVECSGKQSWDRAASVKSPSVNGSATAAARDQNVDLKKRSQQALGQLRAAGVPTDLDWIDGDSLQSYEEMGDPTTTAQVHPYQFTTSMARLATEKDVQVEEGARVQKIVYSASGDKVQGVSYISSQGTESTLEATDVIVAAGPWTRSILPEAPITGLRAHSITIKPKRSVSAYALFTEIKLPPGFGASDVTRVKKSSGAQIVSPEIYARPNQEVYACGEGDHLVTLPETSDLVQVDQQRCQDIADYVGSISEELRDGEITARQACYLPNVNASGSGGPLIGETGVQGLLLAAGHTCWGIQNGPGTGKLISEVVFDGKAKSANIKTLDPRIVL